MQGRHGKSEDFWENPSSDKPLSSLNGTSKLGKQRIHSRRPAGGRSSMPPPPSTPRVVRRSQPSRPQREEKPPRKSRRLVLILVGTIVVFSACFLSFTVVNFFLKGLSTSSGPATAAVDFLNALSDQNYAQAYRDLGSAITIEPQHSQDEFIRQAQSDDRCYGKVEKYALVDNSASIDQQTGSQSYTYTIKRDKMPQPYQLRVTLQQERDGTWKVTSYGDSLGPGQDVPCAQ